MATLNNKLNVEVRGRQGIVFSGDLIAVTGFNTVGVFDVLPGHANFISMITNKVILHKEDLGIDEINLDNGVIVVEDNEVKIFLGVSKV
jgi:F0F1-type ATP synthase epsilon subunit